MSTPLLPDAIYKFINFQYVFFAVDLIGANPHGAIAGYTKNDSTKNQQWRLKNLGDNKVTLESVAAPGTYASVRVQGQGIPLTGSSTPTVWLVLKGYSQFTFALVSEDSRFIWVLPSNKDYTPIVLEPNTTEPREWNAEWSVELRAEAAGNQ